MGACIDMSMRDFAAFVNKLIDPTRRRVFNMVRRGVLVVSNSSKKLQSLQVTARKGELLSDLEHMEPYGFTHRPKKGAEAIILCPAGSSSHGLVIVCADRRYRLQGLQEGEIALYTDEGDTFHFKRGREVELTTRKFTVNASEKFEVNTPNVELNASAKVQANTPELAASAMVSAVGDVQSKADIYDRFGASEQSTMYGMRQIFNNHTHTEQGPEDGDNTSTPNQTMGS